MGRELEEIQEAVAGNIVGKKNIFPSVLSHLLPNVF